MTDSRLARFRYENAVGGQLQQLLEDHLQDQRLLFLAGDVFGIASYDDVPFYDDDPDVLLLRRVRDGMLFEADITLEVRPAWDLRAQIRYHRHYHHQAISGVSIRNCGERGCVKAVSLYGKEKEQK